MSPSAKQKDEIDCNIPYCMYYVRDVVGGDGVTRKEVVIVFPDTPEHVNLYVDVYAATPVWEADNMERIRRAIVEAAAP